MPDRIILDNPPPLTPSALRDFPFVLRTFPAADLVAALDFKLPDPTPTTDALPTRVE